MTSAPSPNSAMAIPPRVLLHLVRLAHSWGNLCLVWLIAESGQIVAPGPRPQHIVVRGTWPIAAAVNGKQPAYHRPL
jgi:hypothetical protein